MTSIDAAVGVIQGSQLMPLLLFKLLHMLTGCTESW